MRLDFLETGAEFIIVLNRIEFHAFNKKKTDARGRGSFA
jgi:hypothetical protein